MQKKILSGLLALTMVVPAFADVSSAGGTGSVPVELNAAATNFSVTVPTGLPVDVAADGTITVCQKNSIVNNSFGPVEVKGAKIETANGWTLKDFGSRFETLKVNAQEFGFQLNEANVNTDGSVAVTNFKPIDGGDSQTFTYDAKAAPQAEELTTQQIASVVFTLGWHDEAVSIDPTIPPNAMGSVLSKERLDEQAKIKTGTFIVSKEKHDPAKHGVGVDVSEAQDGSVICVVDRQNVTVYGEGGVKAPIVSVSLFRDYRSSRMDLRGLDTKGTINMAYMFDGNTSKEIDLSNFDTSDVRDMHDMFHNSRAKELDLSSFDTAKVNYMYDMFEGSAAETINLSSFDMSNVTGLSYMFNNHNTKTIYCRTEEDRVKMINSSGCHPSKYGFIVGRPNNP